MSHSATPAAIISAAPMRSNLGFPVQWGG
jgi:hypothetical protein